MRRMRPLAGMNSHLSPRVQCSTGPFWTFELEVALDILAESGFTEIELMVTRDVRTQAPEIPERLAAERGLRIGSVHGPFLVFTKTVWGLDPVQKIERGVEMCQALGATTLIVHPPHMWERRYARWVVEECEDFCAEQGITVAVETMYPVWVAGRRVRAYRWLDPGDLFAACPWVALDTSHLTVARQDILDAYDLFAPKLVHIHLSNNAGDGRDGHLELHRGILAIDRFLNEIRRNRYAGTVSLELGVGRYIEQKQALVEMLRRNREFIEKRLTSDTRLAKGLPRR